MITVVDHEPAWPLRFEGLRAEYVVEPEHVEAAGGLGKAELAEIDSQQVPPPATSAGDEAPW